MAGPVLYSTNPWSAVDVAVKYRSGRHFAWCSEYFDAAAAPPGSAAAAVAPSSNPCWIYRQLRQDCESEDRHSDLIRRYQKTFRRLATAWLAKREITTDQRDEIYASSGPGSWNIWRPVVYVIPRHPIESAGRLLSVVHKKRAGHGPELQIVDLLAHEFDIIQLEPR
jgi:hypothetical protein